MTWALLRFPVRSSTRTRFAAAAAFTVLALAAGCIASTDSRAELDASEGSGDLVIHLVLQQGQLSEGDAWWEENAPETPLTLDGTADAYEGLVLKNDVRIDEIPLQGSSSYAVLTWYSSKTGTIAEPGDTFEVIVMDTEEDATVATYELIIRP